MPRRNITPNGKGKKRYRERREKTEAIQMKSANTTSSAGRHAVRFANALAGRVESPACFQHHTSGAYRKTRLLSNPAAHWPSGQGQHGRFGLMPSLQKANYLKPKLSEFAAGVLFGTREGMNNYLSFQRFYITVCVILFLSH